MLQSITDQQPLRHLVTRRKSFKTTSFSSHHPLETVLKTFTTTTKTIKASINNKETSERQLEAAGKEE